MKSLKMFRGSEDVKSSEDAE
ncbi:hypothetical protein A2U01_0116888, partial [Trifolium medium]|nr:hypothetical protein [Trifolium medium]